MAPEPHYSFSFITGALFAKESAMIAPLLAQNIAWPEIEARSGRQNLLKLRKSASQVRLLREIKHRLSTLSPAEIKFFTAASPREQNALLFVAICRHYLFIRDFVTEVLVTKLRSLDYQLSLSDYTKFTEAKSTTHPELRSLTDSSYAKVRQVLFRMLAEAGLINSTRKLRLTPPVINRSFVRLVAKTDPKQLCWLLVSDSEIKSAS